MTYINKKSKKAKTNYAAAHRGHMRALEHEQGASAKKIVRANIRADEIFAAEQRAKALASVDHAPSKRSKKEKERRAAALAATKKRRHDRRAAEALAKIEAEVASLAHQLWELRLARQEFVGGDDSNEDDNDDEEDEEELKNKLSDWFGLRRKDDDADESSGGNASGESKAGMNGCDQVWGDALMW
ncbi:hypothetical protein ACHAPC_010292 [Botrytis cinerea]